MEIKNGVLVKVNNNEITNGTCTLPNNITSIDMNAFSDCTNLTEIILSNNITYIGMKAFSGCSNLTKITLPNSIISIGIEAFSGCTSLTKITLPNSITYIARKTFSGCTSLTEIILHNSITLVDWAAFRGCTRLTEITLSNSITYIDRTAFSDCISLEKIIIIGNTIEFERIKSYLPKEEQIKAMDLVNFHLNIIKSFLDSTEDSRNKQASLDEVNSSIEVLQSLIESHEGFEEPQLTLDSYVMKIYLQQNDLESAKEHLEKHPNPPIGMVFDIAAHLFACKEDSTKKNKQFIKLFMEHHKDPDVRMLLKKSAFNLLSGEQAKLNSDVAHYGIDQCLPLSAVLSVIDSITDEPLKKWLSSIKEYLELFSINEIHLFLSIPLLKKAFEEAHKSINMITYESIINLQNVEDVKTYTKHEKTDIEYIQDTINNKISYLKEKPKAHVDIPRLSIFQPEKNLDNNSPSSDTSMILKSL